MTRTVIVIALVLIAGLIYMVGFRGNSTEVNAGQTGAVAAVRTQTATFAGGCFWCMEPPYEKIDGVIDVVSGYIGGHKDNPVYKEVSSGVTGHLEAVEVIYDPTKVTYDELVEVFWRNIDPTDAGGSFVDRGGQYGSAIFYHDEAQHASAIASRDRLVSSGKFFEKIATEIRPASKFFRAEEYHQDYYKRNPIRYKYYRNGSGRDAYLDATWGKEARGEGVIDRLRKADSPYNRPSGEKIKSMLNPLEYKVIMENGTEPQYSSELWKEKRDGIYVDLLSGEPLFSSADKYDSGTGWPSFTAALEPDNLIELEDRSFMMVRTELRSRYGDAHLGHLFTDGPRPEGLRYCMNGVAMRFVPMDELEAAGYGKYLSTFN